jgi:OOP family OmpA-OmpF porin
MKKITIVALLSIWAATPALADNTGNFYVGGDLGSVTFSNSAGPNAPPDFPNPGAIRIAGGYHFMPMFAVEAGLLIIGDSTLSFPGYTVTTKNSALQVAAVGTYPVSSSFDLFAKLGMSMNSNKLTGTGLVSFINSSTTSTTLMFGIGGQYNINQHFGIRAQYEDFGKFKTNDGPVAPVNSWDFGVKMISVGGVYNF